MSNAGYEKKDIPVKPVAIGGMIFIVIVAVTLLLLHEYYIRVVDDTVYEFRLSKRSNKLIELQESEEKALNNYKVVNEEEQIYQIPIDKSKELLLNDKED
ncbi:MAG TPA: hypothetical protein QGF75_01525 [Candidatus Marinimicrobia bacterium]|nr:hypothetical protein [Candidatus Neomarinimicrobiota bacterium]|tara:strand:- start:1901 stop:2200 length:300 start_codon:yes stop_codon:yes gene_type:complete